MPILALTFHSAHYDHLTLRRLVAQVDDAVKQVPLVAETTIIGGAQRQVRVLLDPAQLASRNLSPAGLVPMLQQANRQFAAGGLTSDNHEVDGRNRRVSAQTPQDVGNVVVGVFGGKPVYLRDVADIVDGAEEPAQYVFFGNGRGRFWLSSGRRTTRRHAEHRQTARRERHLRREQVLKKMDTLKGCIIPTDVQVSDHAQLRRDGGGEIQRTAAGTCCIAVVGVSLLILLALGWRESVIVALAIPSTLALTLLVFLSLRLHAQSHHAFRADFLHRHPGG